MHGQTGHYLNESDADCIMHFCIKHCQGAREYNLVAASSAVAVLLRPPNEHARSFVPMSTTITRG